MRNIKLTIEYDGSNYNGWQTQKIQNPKSKIQNKTIQETIGMALRRILQEKIKLIGSGRTDAGVHAKGQVANFKTNSKLSLDKIRKGVNAVLPDDIVIKEAEEVNLDFHSRFDAKSKVYRYTILNRPHKSVFEHKYSYFIPYKLDVDLMRSEIKSLIGRHDFQSFQAADKKFRPSIRTMKKIALAKKGDFIFIDFEAEGFLYKMVRNIVGLLIEIGRGKLKRGSLKKILESKNRKLTGPTAPAVGLCLIKVNY